jgi:hypothetical protein
MQLPSDADIFWIQFLVFWGLPVGVLDHQRLWVRGMEMGAR